MEAAITAPRINSNDMTTSQPLAAIQVAGRRNEETEPESKEEKIEHHGFNYAGR
jgi:hypothetical protein